MMLEWPHQRIARFLAQIGVLFRYELIERLVNSNKFVRRLNWYGLISWCVESLKRLWFIKSKRYSYSITEWHINGSAVENTK